MKIDKFFLNNSAKLIDLSCFKDKRGFFTEIFTKKKFKKLSLHENFVQINHSYNKNVNTIRGLHFQSRPFSQAKLIYVISGSIYDVFIDLRKKSKNYGIINTVKLNSSKKQILYIPKFCAHGFCTLEKNTNVIYLTSNYYEKKSEQTIKYNDDYLNIKWPTKKNKIYISDNDLNGKKFKKINY